MECNKVVDETVAPGDLPPCGCIFKFHSVAWMEDSGHDSSDCDCRELRTVVFNLGD
jgi:hypothetical protein